jgi:type I restriction enzyme S subunit
VGFPENIQGRQDLAVPVFKVGDISIAAKEGRTLLDTSPNTVDQKTAQNLMKVLIPPGATVFAKIGAAIGLNRRAITARPCIVDNNVMAAVPNTACIDPIFLFQFMQTVRLLEKSQATTVPSVRKGDVESIPLPLAPLSEQARIVEALDSYLTRLDAATEGLKRVEANLKRYRASVLKAAVEGNLVPTEAELAKREKREYEPASVLLERILKERRHRWEQAELAKMKAKGEVPKNDAWKKKYQDPASPDASTLPELPEGWCWATVGQLSTKVVDGVHKKPNYVPQGVPFVTVRNLTAGLGISFESLNHITEADHREFVRRANPEAGDVLISKDGTLGVVRTIRTDKVFSIFVSVALVKPVLREMADYLEVALQSPQVQRQMVPKGSGLQHIHLEDLREDAIPLAPLPEQSLIAEQANALLSKADKLAMDIETQASRLARLRQAILRWAFEGKLVDQDPSDEPASVLLERIRRERESSQPVKTPKPERARRKTA